MLRILIIVNTIGLVAALFKTPVWAGIMQEFMNIAMITQPMLLLNILLLYALYKPLSCLPYKTGTAVILVLEMALITLVDSWLTWLTGETASLTSVVRLWILTSVTVFILLGYFNLRNRALSPAFSEARLQALQARIRPHFLFNSINAVLSLVRNEPKQAEQALENMADLFRTLMADNRQLSPLADEVRLCRQYLQLEQLRLGARLKTEWFIDNMPGDALIPPLVLQPLLENAVYHGIEPLSTDGIISINIYRKHNTVHMILRNSYQEKGSHHIGNKMALGNIRERLALHFDAEGRLESRISENTYQVHIVLPFTTTSTSRLESAHP